MKTQPTRLATLAVEALAVMVLALTFNSNTVMAADATWNGGGDGVNWSDLANWTGDPRLASTTIKLNAATSTVNIDTMTAPWNPSGRSGDMWNNSILHIPAGGKLGAGAGEHWRMHTGSVINITGGHFGYDLRPHSLGAVGGTVNVYSGTYNAARITYVKSATVNIYGANSTVSVTDFFSWMDKSQPTLGFFLDAGGVTTFNFGSHGNDNHPNSPGMDPDPVTINVSGIATYAAGAKPKGDTFYLVKDTNSDLYHPHAWPLGMIVDGGLGFVRMVNNGVTLSILPSAASVWEGGTFDWNTAHWTVGGTANQLPGTAAMTVGVAGSVVTVADNANCDVLQIGTNNACTVNVSATKTLTADLGVSVVTNGTLNVDGTLTTPLLATAGSVTVASGGTLSATNVTTSGSLTVSSSGALNATNITVTTSGSLTAGGTLSAADVTTSGSLTVGTLSANNVTFIGTPSHSCSGTISASTAFKSSSAVKGPEVQVPGADHTVTIGANLTGNAGFTGRNDAWACHRAILTGTNSYTGVTQIGSASSIIRAEDYVGLPRDSFLKLEGYKQPAGMELGADLVREGGTSGAGKMLINLPDGGGFTAVGTVAGANPVVVCFGTLLAPESLTWGTAPFQVGSNAGSFGLNGGQAAANNTIDFRNPINLGDGSSNKKGNILVDSITYPATMSGVLSGTAGANPNLTKKGNGVLILTAKNTYTGNTQIEAGTLTLADNAQLKFVIPATSGGNSTIYGAGTCVLNGDFYIDTTAPDATGAYSSTWQLENVTSLTGAYGSTFQVVDGTSTPWTDAGGDKWTKTVGDKLYTFAETNGTLTLTEFIIPTGAVLLVK